MFLKSDYLLIIDNLTADLKGAEASRSYWKNNSGLDPVSQNYLRDAEKRVARLEAELSYWRWNSTPHGPIAIR